VSQDCKIPGTGPTRIPAKTAVKVRVAKAVNGAIVPGRKEEEITFHCLRSKVRK
jgi:hypothetical protein